MYVLEMSLSLTHDFIIARKINSLKHRLDRLREVYKSEYPDDTEGLESIPSADGIDMAKLIGATVTTDTCTPAQKARRDFCVKINRVSYQQDCMNHLRCVWCKQVEKELCKVLQVIVMDTMDEIAPELRVSCLSALTPVPMANSSA